MRGQNNCWHVDWCQEWNIKTSLLKISKIKYITLLSDENVPSVSGHSSELNIANHSSRSPVSQLKCVSDTISSWFENHQPQKTKIYTVIYAPKLESNAGLQVDRNHKFSKGIFSFPAIFKATSKLFAHRAAPMTKTDLIFPSFSSRFVDFAVQFCVRCKFSLGTLRIYDGDGEDDAQ